MDGGGPGALGRNTWVKQLRKEDGDLTSENGGLVSRDINIGGKATVWMGKGDRMLIETPGGGAWGMTEADAESEEVKHVRAWEPRGSVAERAAAQAAF
jgi:5-oxoprolinase (ATP-hydrolysing)